MKHVIELRCGRDRSGVHSRYFQDLCAGRSELFYENCLVYNFCPLSFMEDSARNITPDQLRGEAKKRLLEFCDEALRKVVELLQPDMIVGVGKFA